MKTSQLKNLSPVCCIGHSQVFLPFLKKTNSSQEMFRHNIDSVHLSESCFFSLKGHMAWIPPRGGNDFATLIAYHGDGRFIAVVCACDL